MFVSTECFHHRTFGVEYGFVDGFGGAEVGILIEKSYASLLIEAKGAVIGLLYVSENAQKAAFSTAVAANERNFLALLEAEGKVTEKFKFAVGKAEFIYRKEIHAAKQPWKRSCCKFRRDF